MALAALILWYVLVWLLNRFSSTFRSLVEQGYYHCQVLRFKSWGHGEGSAYFSNWGYVDDQYPCSNSEAGFPRYQQCCENLYRFCIGFLGELSGQRVLEIGCGKGAGSRFFTQSEYHGIDLSEESIKHCKKTAKGQFHALEATRATELDIKFDKILNIESLMHYPDLEKFFSVIPQLMQPGGTYVATTIVYPKDAFKQMAMFKLPGLKVVDISPHVRQSIDTWLGAYPWWITCSATVLHSMKILRFALLVFIFGPLILWYEKKHFGYFRWRYLLLVYQHPS